jgi:hypothetical protein
MAWTKAKTAVAVGVGALLLLAVGAAFIVWQLGGAKPKRPAAARAASPRAKVWTNERAAEAKRIKSREKVNETTNATTIDLKPYITAKLTDGPFGWKGNDDDNLSELPPGQHIYAGVPFDVSGSVQLTGGWLKRYKKPYPAQVAGIPIDRSCSRFHLLHGNGFIINTNFGTVVAKLVIHYENGTSNDLNLVAGENAFDWWNPLFKTGVPERWLQMAPGTERAWTGSNPYIRKWQPELSLILYRTTFDNPQPEVKVSSVDYVSTQTITSPFLVGLTVD